MVSNILPKTLFCPLNSGTHSSDNSGTGLWCRGPPILRSTSLRRNSYSKNGWGGRHLHLKVIFRGKEKKEIVLEEIGVFLYLEYSISRSLYLRASYFWLRKGIESIYFRFFLLFSKQTCVVILNQINKVPLCEK